MSPERWEKIQRIFRIALTEANDFDAGCLDRECGSDTELRREVESLIAAGRSMEGFFEGAIGGAAAAFDGYEPEFEGDERFAVLRRLGSGGFGVVYQVYDRHRETILALKTLRRTESGPLLQFKREFRVLADISHPNLVTLHELFSEKGRWFFTMELVEGVDFLRYTRSLGDDFDGLRHVMRQLADGLSVVHQYGKLHCDLKPRNVLVDNGGRVLILDFGLVTDFSGADTGGALRFGTPGYMSPEQAAGLPLYPASDWYSVGVILYQALTGEMPFPGSVSSVVCEKTIDDFVPVARLRPNAPGDLCDLTAALMQPNPLLRPTGSQVLRSLGMPAEESIRATWMERVPFLGRENEMATLRKALSETGCGRLTTVFIQGPSGVGKSALARQFLDEVRELKTHLVLEGCCHERESTPYKALDSLVDNLNRHLGCVPEAERTALMPNDFSLLTRLFPVLESLVGKPGPVAIPNAAELRLRGFQALRELLTRLAVCQPIVLLIDDLQWGDMDSAPFLLDLVSDPGPARILFLACFRSDEADSSPLLRQLLHARSLGTSGHRIELPVQDLEYSAARDLALWLLSRHESIPPSLAGQIAHESGGNPFFLAQLVKHWQTESRQERDDRPATAEDWTPRGVSISLDDLIRRRVANLPERPRRLLEVIALAGQPIDLAIAKDAARLEVAAYMELAELRRHRLIRTRRTEGSEEIEAYHDRIRRGTEGSLSPEGLRDCHFRLATAWESAGRSDARFLAVHFRAAAMSEKALAYSIRAAEQAAAALAFDNAAQFYQFAVELASESQRAGWQVKLGEALCNAGRGAEGARVYLAAGAASGSKETLELQRRAAAHFLMAGRIDEGLALTQEVLKMVGMSLPRWTWQALLSFFFQRIWIRARGLKFRERPLSGIPAARLLRIDICASLVQGLAMVDPIRALPFHARLLLLALRSGELSRISRAFCFEADYLALEGGCMKDQVKRLLRSAQELAERSGRPEDAGLVALANGVAFFLRGEWRNAADQMTFAEGILRERCTGVSWEVATAHVMGSVSLFLMGEWKELTRRLPRLIKDAETRGDLFEATDLRIRLSHSLCIAADNAEHAHEEIRSALAGWRREEFDLQHWWAWIGSIETDLYRGEGRSAWTRVRAEWPRLRWSFLMRVQYVRIESLHHRARAALALAATGTGAARAGLLGRAERDARTMQREGPAWSSALATLLRAGISASRGALEQSVHLLESAEIQFKACDMALYAMAAQRARGQLVGGARGRELSADAEKWMQNEEILNPQRIAAMLAPGF